MYNIFTKSRSVLAAALFSIALLFSSSAMAGPGKPGDNPFSPGGNIVEVAVAANQATGLFDTVLAAATCPYFDGAVVDILTGDDKVTLFAPTDDAFGALGLDQDNVCTLPAGDLLTILGYHVTEGRRFSNSVFNAYNVKSVDMLFGGSIETEVVGGDPLIYDNQGGTSMVIIPNLNASNGVIHVVNAVLLP